MLDNHAPGVASAGDDVDNPRWQISLLADLGEQQGGQGGALGGLEHDGVATGKCWRDFPSEHEQWKVPGDDLAGDTKCLGVWAKARVIKFVGPAGVVEEVRCSEGYVNVAGLANWLAVIKCFKHRELTGPLLQ